MQDLQRVGGMTLREMSEQHGVSERTISRDLAALERAGFKLDQEHAQKRKLWKLDVRAQANKLSSLLDKAHYLALSVAMGQGGLARANPTLFGAMEDLSDKIENALGARGRQQIEDIQRCFYSYEKHAYTHTAPEILWPLIAAIVDQRVCQVTYRKPYGDHDKGIEILPLQIFAHQGAAYLMTYFLKHASVGNLNLQRVKKLDVLDRRAEPPADFDPAQYENAAFGVHTGAQLERYTLRFRPEVAGYIRERTWHASQALTDLDDGGVELTFTCGESWEVSAWVASWRQAVEVIEPASLRDELGELGKVLAERYG